MESKIKVYTDAEKTAIAKKAKKDKDYNKMFDWSIFNMYSDRELYFPKAFIKEAVRVQAIDDLRKQLKPGATLKTILMKVSASGMTRRIKVMDPKGNNITWLVSKATGRDMNDDGLKVSGCGMDMGFHLVYTLSHTLYPKGFRLPKGVSGRNGDKSRTDKDGGYALNQQWF